MWMPTDRSAAHVRKLAEYEKAEAERIAKEEAERKAEEDRKPGNGSKG